MQAFAVEQVAEMLHVGRDKIYYLLRAGQLRRADENFAAEAAAARDTGHDVALIDHDALAEPGGTGRAVARVPDGGGTAVYRGWMLASGRYATLAEARVTLRTSAGQYRQAYELPGWYPGTGTGHSGRSLDSG